MAAEIAIARQAKRLDTVFIVLVFRGVLDAYHDDPKF